MPEVTLRVLAGADRGKEFGHLGTPVTIGREEGNTIQLNDEQVSRFHLKIQVDRDELVLTDLESTNGTKVNGEVIQLRILRYGDVIHVGRSQLLYGTRDQIASRLAALRMGGDPNLAEGSETGDPSPDRSGLASLDFELSWDNDPDLQSTLHWPVLPEIPRGLSPAQAAQLSELLDYTHVRIRNLIHSVKTQDGAERFTLEARQWQNLIDLQSRLSELLRSVSEPDEPFGDRDHDHEQDREQE